MVKTCGVKVDITAMSAPGAAITAEGSLSKETDAFHLRKTPPCE